MGKLILLFWGILGISQAMAQSRLYTDVFGNIYQIKPDNEILRIDSNGKVLANWRDRNLGKLSSFDLLNPLKPLAFYAETATLMEFDNNLYPINKRVIEEARNCANPLFCRSADNKIWFFDDRSLCFIKYETEGLTSIQGPRLNQFFPVSFQALDLIEHQRQLFLLVQNEGVWVFDFYGAFLRKIPAKGLIDMALQGDTIWLQLPESMLQFHLKTLLTVNWPLQNYQIPESIAPASKGLYFLRQGRVTLWP